MKKTLHIMIGLVLGIGLTVGSVSLANSDTIQAMFSKFNIFINGEEQVLETDPILYQGTTYLPIRAISGMLGYDVGYENATKTIRLDIGEDYNQDEWINLRSLTDMGVTISFPNGFSHDAVLKFVERDIEFKYPKLANKVIVKLENSTGTLKIQSRDSRTYFYKLDLFELGILPVKSLDNNNSHNIENDQSEVTPPQDNEPSNDEFVFNPDEWVQLREAFEGCYFTTDQVSIDEAILGFNNDCIYKMLLPKLENGVIQSVKTNASGKHVRIVLYEHRTHIHKEDLAEIENFDFSYKVGEEFTVGIAQIKVNDVYYTNQYREFSPGVGNKYAVINFDVYTEKEPSDQFYWNALNFCSSIIVDDKTLVGGISTNHDRISSGKTHTVECRISIPNDRTVSAIQFRDPSSTSRELAEVTVD